LECKLSNYQYHNKLQRLTCPRYPDVAPNRYKELCHVGWQWRNLKYRKWFWLLHNLNGKRGEMAVFCAACPQDGVNLQERWELDIVKNLWAPTTPHKIFLTFFACRILYMRSFVADGNFKANHLKQKNDNLDVWLTSVEGFMTNTAHYKIHLQAAKETKTVSNSNTIYF